MRILVVTGRYPWPTRRGDQLRATQTIAALRLEHQVTLLTPAPPPGAPDPSWGEAEKSPGEPVRVETYTASASPLATSSSLARGRPVQSAVFARPGLAERVASLASQHDLVLLQLLRLEGALDKLDPRHPVLVDFIDSLSLHFARRALIDRPLLRPFWRFEAARLANAEARLLQRSATSWAIASRDVRALDAVCDEAPAPELIRLVVQAREAGPAAEAGPPAIGFTGNLAYFPNRDAATWFARAAWPLLRARVPELQFVVAGHRPGRALTRLAGQARGMRLVASPPDLRQVVRASRVLVAPVRCGAGVPVKVLEAWGERRPIVVSPWAASGTDGEDGLHFGVADSGEAWADQVCALLENPERAHEMGRQGGQLLDRLHSPEAVGAKILESLGEL